MPAHVDLVDAAAKHVIPASEERLAQGPSLARRTTWPEADTPVVDEETDLDEIYERYSSYVGALALRLLGRAAEVEDVVQDVFAAAVRGLRRRNNVWQIKGWLAKVTVRRCTWELRAR
jgi:DNA-directed RNA polymerase specialized sigma24 family protein